MDTASWYRALLENYVTHAVIWKMVHNLLPSRERLYRLSMQDIEDPLCDLCTLAVRDDLEHALLLCPYNAASSYTLRLIQNFIPRAQPNRAVLLDLDIPPDLQLPVTFILSFCLSRIWRYRSLKNRGNPRGIRAELEAEIQILRKSRFHEAADKL